jgi:hypothetical protein
MANRFGAKNVNKAERASASRSSRAREEQKVVGSSPGANPTTSEFTTITPAPERVFINSI